MRVLRDFPYSVTGNDRFTALAGQDTDAFDTPIPANLLEGLIQSGYLQGDIVHPEIASKAAGEAAANSDLAGVVDSTASTARDFAAARAGISDGNIGAPEAASIIDAHRVTELSDPAVLNRAQAEADAAGNGVTTPVSAVTGEPGDASKAEPDPNASAPSPAVEAVADAQAAKKPAKASK